MSDDGKPLDYQDEEGTWWVMCACGHRCGGSPRPGDKIALCPNCRFTLGFTGGSVPIVYEDRVPLSGRNTEEGDHPDHVAWRIEKVKRDEKNRLARERRKARKGR